MLAIRMQRTGRTGHAHYRVIVQDSRWSPKSGKFVALLGNYDPHTKTVNLVKEKAQFYLSHGAQPSDRIVRLFKQEGLKIPEWVVVSPTKESKTRNLEKLRKNRQAGAPVTIKEEPAAEAEAAIEENIAEPAAEKPVNEVNETDAPTEENAPAEPAEIAIAPEQTPAAETAEPAPEA